MPASGRSQADPDSAVYAFLLHERREEKLDRVDFVSLKEDLLDKIEMGGAGLGGMLPDGVCDFQGRLHVFPQSGQARFVTEGADSVSWLYSCDFSDAEDNKGGMFFFHSIRLSGGELLHLLYMGVAARAFSEGDLLSKARDLARDIRLQNIEIGWTDKSTANGDGFSVNLFAILFTCLFGGFLAAVFYLKRSSR